MRTKQIALGVVAASLAVAAPASAQSGSSHKLSKRDLHGVPARVASRLKRAERALSRAEDAIDDNDSATAATRLGAADKSLARAFKAVGHRLDDSDVTSAFAMVTDDIIETTSGDFDGQDGDVVTGLATLLGDAIADRDTVVAGIDDSDVLSQISDDASNEADDIAESLSDDTLTDAATSALDDAATKVAATESAASDAADAADSSDSSDDASDDSGDDSGPGGDCPSGHGGGHGGGGNGPTGASGPTGPAANSSAPSA